jgi:hypothetical protein
MVSNNLSENASITSYKRLTNVVLQAMVTIYRYGRDDI